MSNKLEIHNSSLIEKKRKKRKINSKSHLCVCIMVKNEEEGVIVSLDSVKDVVSSVVIFDTGSTDNTIYVVKDWCVKNNIPLYLKEEEFVDFSVSRNAMMEFAESTVPDAEYHLLLDSRDELRGGDKLMVILRNYRYKEDSGAFLITQKWFQRTTNEYLNVKLLRPNYGWKYCHPVHEFLHKKDGVKDRSKITDPDIFIYQDRTKDGGKSFKRFERDKELLLKAYEASPTEGRIVFYLAQTFGCLGDKENAYKYYIERTKLSGFYEEIFHAYLRAGDCSVKLKKPWELTMGLYLNCFNCFNMNRAEPLIRIAQYYQDRKQWKLSHTFAKAACALEYPKDHILFIDSNTYNYTRWHILGVVSYYCGDIEIYNRDGLEGSTKALEQNINVKIDASNLKFYKDRLKIE